MGYDEFNITARAVAKGLVPPGTNGNTAKIGYGCWFYTAANATFWTGAAHVNVGRSLRGATRCQLNAFLYGTAKSGERAIGHCFANPGDKFWCTFARALGYDSIQVSHGGATYQAGKRKGRKRPLGELVDCTRPCMEERFTSDACVPEARAVHIFVRSLHMVELLSACVYSAYGEDIEPREGPHALTRPTERYALSARYAKRTGNCVSMVRTLITQSLYMCLGEISRPSSADTESRT